MASRVLRGVVIPREELKLDEMPDFANVESDQKADDQLRFPAENSSPDWEF